MNSPRSAPSIIDVEASGFGPGSYPIEVGVALPDGRKFCALLRPAPGWTHWDARAESVHHVSRATLQTYGRPIAEVVSEMNTLMAGTTLYSDGWVVDKPWLTELFFAARARMDFYVSPLEAILSEAQMASWHGTKDRVLSESDSQRHRASYDAWVIQETWRRTAAAD